MKNLKDMYHKYTNIFCMCNFLYVDHDFLILVLYVLTDILEQHWYPCTKLYNVTDQKTTVNIYTTVKTSNAMYFFISGQIQKHVMTVWNFVAGQIQDSESVLVEIIDRTRSLCI